MDAQTEILKLKGRIGGLSRVANKNKAEKEELQTIIEKAMKMLKGHMKLCGDVSGGSEDCGEGCVAWDNCWEASLLKVLRGEE